MDADSGCIEEILGAFRESMKGNATPVILVADQPAEELALCRTQGVVAYLGKPLHFASILKAVRFALDLCPAEPSNTALPADKPGRTKLDLLHGLNNACPN